MGWSDQLAIETGRLKTWVYGQLAQMFLATLTADSSPIGHADSVESCDEGSDPGAPASEQKGSRPVARYQPWGFQGRPPKGLRGIALRLGSSNLVWLGVAPQQKYGPQNLDVGETAIFSTGGCQVHLDKDGNVVIAPAAGKTVQVAGNSYSLLKTETLLGDLNTLMGYLATWVPLVVTAVAAAPSGTAPDPGVAAQASSISTAIGAGTYKSTAAKNG